MNRTKAYVNRLVKIKEQEIQDAYHQNHLKEMKPINKKLMEHSETIIINHGKREMIKQVREIQIERENKMLLQKIADVMGKKGTYSVAKTKNIRTKVNKSLNQIYRKRQLENIQLENKRFLQRLQTKRPTLNLQKMNREWLQNKSMLKRIANADFYLANIQSSSRMRSITAQKFNKSKYEKMRLIKSKIIDGQKMLIKIQFAGEFLKIIGDPQDKSDIKIIQIPKDEAMILIQKDCQGKFQFLLEKLKYDTASQTLYIVSDNLQEQEIDFSQFNPEMDKIINKTQSNIKKVVSQEQKDKTLSFKGKTNQSVKQTQKPIEAEHKTVNNEVEEKQVKQEKIERSKQFDQQIIPMNQQQIQINKNVLIQQKPAENQEIKEFQNEHNETKKDQIETKEDHIEVKEVVKIQPQEQQKYEEQNFDQSHPKQQEVAETEKRQYFEQPLPEQKQIIVQPQSAQNYNEQFQARGQVIPQKIVQQQQKING